jgi:hypothetical protein
MGSAFSRSSRRRQRASSARRSRHSGAGKPINGNVGVDSPPKVDPWTANRKPFEADPEELLKRYGKFKISAVGRGARRHFSKTWTEFKKINKMAVIGVGLELGFGIALTAAGTIRGASEWGTPTGRDEDYVGGGIHGGVRGFGSGLGGAVGGIVGGFVGSLVPLPFSGILGAVAGTFVGEGVGGNLFNSPAKSLGMGARALVKTSRAVDRVQFGGGFVDSASAYTMRQNAVQEMSGSMLNARQFLGNEAIFLHER